MQWLCPPDSPVPRGPPIVACGTDREGADRLTNGQECGPHAQGWAQNSMSLTEPQTQGAVGFAPLRIETHMVGGCGPHSTSPLLSHMRG